VPGPSCLEVETDNAKLKKYWFKQEVKYYCLWSTNSSILFGIRRNCLIYGRSLLLYQFTKKSWQNWL
jgi:hypothetical protein